MCPLELQSARPAGISVAKIDGDGTNGDLSGLTPSVLPYVFHSDLATLQREDEDLKQVWICWDSRRNPGQGFDDGVSDDVKPRLREWSRLTEQKGVLYRLVDDPGLGQVRRLLVPKLPSQRQPMINKATEALTEP